MQHNLHIYELVLLFLGAFLFLILSGAFIYYVVKKEEIKKLLFFFPIPILMIAYPSIKEINISSDKIELSKYQKEYEDNPEDTVALKKIEELTEELESRATSEEDLVQIGKSNLLLGNPEKAITAANKVIKTKEKNSNTSSYDNQKNNLIKEAYQIRKIAKIQQQSLKQKDTVGISAKLNKLKLSPELKKVSSIVKTRTKNSYAKE